MLFNFDFKNSFHLLCIIIIDVFGLKNTHNIWRNCRLVDWAAIRFAIYRSDFNQSADMRRMYNKCKRLTCNRVIRSLFFNLFVFILASLLHRIHFVPTKWLFSLKMMINLNSSDECLWLLFLLNFFSKCSRFKTNAGPIDNITLICSGFFVKVFGRIAFEWHNHLNSLYKRTVNYMYIEIMT